MADAQDLHIGLDLDYAAGLETDELDASSGGGALLRPGAQVDLVAVTMVFEGAGGYHGFSEDFEVWQGLLGARLRVGAVLEPGVFAHVGVGRMTGDDAHTAPSADAGLSLDLTLLPLLDIGIHGAFNTLLGTSDHANFSWITGGAHVALVL